MDNSDHYANVKAALYTTIFWRLQHNLDYVEHTTLCTIQNEKISNCLLCKALRRLYYTTATLSTTVYWLYTTQYSIHYYNNKQLHTTSYRILRSIYYTTYYCMYWLIHIQYFDCVLHYIEYTTLHYTIY